MKHKKKKGAFSYVLPYLILLCGIAIVLFFFQRPSVVTEGDLRFAVGTTVRFGDLVREVKNGTILNADDTAFSDKAGTREITVRVKNRLGMESERYLTLTFFDDTAPLLTVPEEITIQVGETPDLMAGVSATDDSGEAVIVSVSGEYDASVPGDYTITYTCSDGAGNAAKKSIVLHVLSQPFDEDGHLIDGVYRTKNGFELVITGGIAYVDGVMIVNKSYPLPRTYASSYMTKETQAAYEEMKAAAKKDGFNLSVVCAYRSWGDQNIIFNNYVKRDGLQEAMTYSARPGHSEHQTGLCMDLIKADRRLSRVSPYVEPLNWLNENAYRYGFVLRFPADQEEETGYVFESWHYRYVGKELAEKLYNGGNWISLERYFGLDSVYRGYDD